MLTQAKIAMSKGILILMSISLCCFLSSCNYHKYDELVKPNIGKTTVVLPDTVSFSNNIMPILNNNCASCHDATHYSASARGIAVYDYRTISNFTAPHDSTCYLIACITHSPNISPALFMPNNGTKLSDADIALMVKWVYAGAKNN